MSVVEIRVGSRSFQLACEAGQEQHLHKLAEEVDRKMDSLSKQMRTGNESMLFLMTALMLQDELNEATKKLQESGAKLNNVHEEDMAETLNTISSYLENIVGKIESRKVA